MKNLLLLGAAVLLVSATTGCHSGCPSCGGGLFSRLHSGHHGCCKTCGHDQCQGGCHHGGHGCHAGHGHGPGCHDGHCLGGRALPGHHGHDARAAYQMAENPGPPGAQIAYPYYTTRGPRDFLNPNPRGIGP